MSKIFVVMARSYEYNDETYDAEEGGNALIAYGTEQEAEDAARLKTVDAFKSGDFHELLGWDDLFEFSDELDAVLAKIGLSSSEFDGGAYDAFEKLMELAKTLSVSDLGVLAEQLKQPMFFVTEIDLEK